MSDRLERVRAKVRELNLDAFLVSSLTNLRYLTGFTGSNALGIVTHEHTFLITDNRYRDQAPVEASEAEIIIGVDNLYHPIKDHHLLQNARRVAFEAHHLSFYGFSRLRKIAPKHQYVATENLVEKIVAIKLPGEIENIKKACQLAKQAWTAILPQLQSGMTEIDVVAELSYQALKSGAATMAFDPIVASGLRSALPHGTATDKKLAHGELVIIDFGCEVDGLKSDVTRTLVVGEPTEKQRQMYDAVKTANDLAFSSIEAEMLAADLDQIVRDKLGELGYQKEFSHSLGHGLGLAIHELPRIGHKSKDRLQVQSVFTIEPGVYVPGIGGVRIEDDIWLAESGPQRLTEIERDLVTIH